MNGGQNTEEGEKEYVIRNGRVSRNAKWAQNGERTHMQREGGQCIIWGEDIRMERGREKTE